MKHVLLVGMAALALACGSEKSGTDKPGNGSGPMDDAGMGGGPGTASDAGSSDAASETAHPMQVFGFSGSALDYRHWDDFSKAGALRQSNGLFLTPSGTGSYSRAALATSFRFSGDFDVETDWQLVSGWTEPVTTQDAHLDVALEAFADDTHHATVARSKGTDGAERVFTFTAGASANYAEAALSADHGKLRVVRHGTRLTLSYRDGAAWQTLNELEFTNEPVHIVLSASSVGVARTYTAEFGSLVVNTGSTNWSDYVDRPFHARADLDVGVVPADYLAARIWGAHFQTQHPLDALVSGGFKWVRVGVTTRSSSQLASTPVDQWRSLGWQDEFWSAREYAETILKDAAQRGMRLNVFLFLSDTAAHAGMQNPPADWAGLSLEDTATRVEQYAYDTALYFAQQGLSVERYDIGNEIDTGILGFRPGERIALPAGVDINCDVHWMQTNVWTPEAKLLSAAIRGVRRANVKAKIALHVAGGLDQCLGVGVRSFFETMVALAVDFDVAGISHPYPSYPWALADYQPEWWLERLQMLVRDLKVIGKPVIISEVSYPHAPAGSVADPVPGWPFDAGGQAKFVRAQLRFVSNEPNVLGWFYFYPEWYPGFGNGAAATQNLESAGLFTSDTATLPALDEVRVNL